MHFTKVEGIELKLRHLLAAFTCGLLAISTLFTGVSPAAADEYRVGNNLIPGGRGLSLGTYVDEHSWYVWLGTENGSDPYQFCIEMYADNPAGAVVSEATIPEATPRVDGLEVTAAQMAWLLEKYAVGGSSDDTFAALSLLIHANFEQDPRSSVTYSFHVRPDSAAQSVQWLVETVQMHYPGLMDIAKGLVAEARNSGARSYEAGTVTGEGQLTGTISSTPVRDANGSAIAGVPVTITLNGPAVFVETGTNSWSGTTSEDPITLNWKSTANGVVSFTTHTESKETVLKRIEREAGQSTVIRDQQVTVNEETSPEWNVAFDFQPRGVSEVVRREVSDGTVRDTFTTSVDESYGNGKWGVGPNGAPVPVQYRVTAYWAGTKAPAVGAVPDGAEVLGSKLVEATGAGQKLSAEFAVTKRGYVTWVWEVLKADQGEYADYVHADWADQYGLETETSRENFPFRPLGVSNVADAKVIDAGEELTDNFVANADPEFMDGEWTRFVTEDFTAGEYVPVTYRADLYYVSAANPLAEPGEVPEGAELVTSVTATATKPGQQLTVDGGAAAKRGFYTWVWHVDAADQSEEAAQWIEAGWSNQYGMADETASVRYEAVIDTQLHFRETKSGLFLVDDVWVTGMPAGHPEFAGGAGFKADAKVIEHSVYFFTLDQEVSDANLENAQKIGETVTIPAKNGFYLSVGDPSWKVVTDESGQNVPGTYVFVSTFAGDDRVKPLTTSAADTFEQFNVEAIDSLLTFEDARGPVYAFGERTLVDHVPFYNLTVDGNYVLTSTLVDKGTGEALLDADGKRVEVRTEFTPEVANGSQNIEFVLDASLYAGKTVVAFEKLSLDGRVVATHEDLDDPDQTLTFYPAPELQTTLMYQDAKDPVPGHGKRTLVDRVFYSNVEPGKEYTVTGTLMDKATGEPIVGDDGAPVTASTTLTPETMDGSVDVAFEVDAGAFAEKQTVAFETMSMEGVEIAVHADLEDEGQTIPFTPAPKIITTATDTVDGDHALKPERKVSITDKVCDANGTLVPSTTYEITGSLVYSDGQPVVGDDGKPVTKTVEFTPENAENCAEVLLEFDGSKMAGTTVVVFEDVYLEGMLIGQHHDLKDEAQTLTFDAPKPLAKTGASIPGIAGLTLAMLLGGLGALALRTRK